ncbi:MAG: hypothetical protein H6766_08015 [Candidatus Peribacteria bacterium]|nr:MAG: hypothetical protein H6766_08015 [Candidatus Peribacteria bacterium]
MKKRFRLLGTSLLLSACVTTIDNPSTYDERITDFLTQSDEIYESYNQFTQSNDIDNVIIIRDELTKTTEKISTIHDKLIAIGPYQNDTSYLDAAASYLTHTIALLTNEETQLLSLRAEVANYPDAEWTTDIELSYKEKQQTLIDAINTQIASDNEMIEQAQAAFAAQYGLTLSGTIQE